MRLDRMLVALGWGSRNQVQKLIRSGVVTVANQVERDPGAVCSEGVTLQVRGADVDTRMMRHVMLHKPSGLLTAARDRRQPTVMELLPPVYTTLGCMPVGRLDKDTTGLLLLTCDGALNHRLLSPGRHVRKTYRAVVDGPLGAAEVAAFAGGLTLSDFTALPAQLEVLLSGTTESTARVIVEEGKFHQIKRMFAAVGRNVMALHRESFGPLHLDSTLAPGAWRELTEEEVCALYAAAQMEETHE